MKISKEKIYGIEFDNLETEGKCSTESSYLSIYYRRSYL